MKCRNGFVSNSSSSSFLIYGVKVEPMQFREAVNTLIARGEVPGWDEAVKEEEYISEFDGVLGLNVHAPWDYADEPIYVGLSWDRVGDDETGRQFKNRAEDAIRTIFPMFEGKFGTHSEAWRDG